MNKLQIKKHQYGKTLRKLSLETADEKDTPYFDPFDIPEPTLIENICSELAYLKSDFYDCWKSFFILAPVIWILKRIYWSLVCLRIIKRKNEIIKISLDEANKLLDKFSI